MRKSFFGLMILSIVPFLSGTISSALENNADLKPFQILKGEYLGQEKPGSEPEPFAPELLSKALGLSFSLDGKELYFASWGGNPRAVIKFMKMENGQWTEPQTVPFSGKCMDWDLYLSPDGKRLYFSSVRPLEGPGEPKDPDIWFVEKNDLGEWGEPENLGPPVNTEKDEVHPTVSSTGTIYFFAGYEEGFGSADLYRSKFSNGRYLKPENLGDTINSKYAEMDPFIAADESYLIFHSPRPGGLGGNDLYISYRQKDGSLSKPINMGPQINSDKNDYCGRVSPDGRFFFFKSLRNRKSYNYWVDSKVIQELKEKEQTKKADPKLLDEIAGK